MHARLTEPSLPTTGSRQLGGWEWEKGTLRGVAAPGYPSPILHILYGFTPLLSLGYGGISQAPVCPEKRESPSPSALSSRLMALRVSPARCIPPELPALHSCPAEDSAEQASRRDGLSFERGPRPQSWEQRSLLVAAGSRSFAASASLRPRLPPPSSPVPPRSETLIPSAFWPSASLPPHLL